MTPNSMPSTTARGVNSATFASSGMYGLKSSGLGAAFSAVIRPPRFVALPDCAPRGFVAGSYPWPPPRSIAYTRSMSRVSIGLIILLLAAPAAFAQITVGQGGVNDYQARYGEPVEVS